MLLQEAIEFVGRHGRKINQHAKNPNLRDPLRGPCGKLMVGHYQYVRSTQPVGQGGTPNDGADRRFCEAASDLLSLSGWDFSGIAATDAKK